MIGGVKVLPFEGIERNDRQKKTFFGKLGLQVTSKNVTGDCP